MRTQVSAPKIAFAGWSCIVTYTHTMYGSASENFYSEGNSRGNQLRMVELVFCSLIQILRLVHLKSNPKSWIFSPGQAYFLIFEVLIHPWIFHFKIMREARVILVPPWEDESILRHGRFFDYMKIQTFVTQSSFTGLWGRRWLIGLFIWGPK